jgi:hypothetical protein
MKTLCAIFTLVLLSAPCLATVTITSPANGAKVTSPALFAAKSAAGSCSKGIATMGVAVDNELVYVIKGSNLETSLALKVGKHNITIHEWDHCGKSTQAKRSITVAASAPPPTSQPPKLIVTSPAKNSSVTSPATYVATASSPSCAAGISSVGIYEGNSLLASQNGGSLNTSITLNPGTQNTTVQALDNCGSTAVVPISVTVQGSHNMLTNLQSSGGWESHGQLPPHYADCSPCSGIKWSMTPNVASPSLSGHATEFDTSGTKPYAVVLWVDPVIGAYSTQGLPDKSKTLVPSLYNFTYDTDFYVTNTSFTHALEFDVAMYMQGIGMFWGTQCAQGGDGDWDILDKGGLDWVNSGVPCNYVNGWNHLTLQFRRNPDNSLLYKSITLNGVTSNLNVTYPPQKVSSTWYGITVNYQMDGDKYQDTNTTYLDNLTLTYW